MELSKQLCNLEFSQRLKKLGVKQESLYFWIDYTLEGDFAIRDRKPNNTDIFDHYSAYTCSELGEMLPMKVELKEIKEDGWLYISQTGDGWSMGYGYVDESGLTWLPNLLIDDKNEANCRAKMLIYLLENGLLDRKSVV